MVGRSHAIPCPGCGYDLRASTNRDGARCPECGGRFTWPELGTPRLSWVMRRADRIMFWCAIGPGMIGILGLLWLGAIVLAGWIGSVIPMQAPWSVRVGSAALHIGLILLSNLAVAVVGGTLILLSVGGAF